MGPKKLSVLTSFFFFTRKCTGRFPGRPKKRWPYYRSGHRITEAGLNCTSSSKGHNQSVCCYRKTAMNATQADRAPCRRGTKPLHRQESSIQHSTVVEEEMHLAWKSSNKATDPLNMQGPNLEEYRHPRRAANSVGPISTAHARRSF